LAVVFAVAGFGLVAMVASVPASPLQPVLPGGAEASGPFRWLGALLGLDALRGSALAAASVVAVGVAAVSFLCVLREAWRGNLSLWLVVALTVAFHAALLFLPLLVSRDVFSYALYGRIAGVHGANPYVATPVDFRSDPLFAFIGPKWADTPAVYGPGFSLLSAAIARLIDGLPALITAFRAIAIAASLGTVGIVWWICRRMRPERAAFAVAILGLNPVVLFQSAGSGHNDLLVALAVAGSLALVLSRRELLATVALTLGMLVKVTAALPLLLLIVWVVARREPGERLRAFLLHAGVSGGLFLLFAGPFLQTEDPTLGMLELAGHEGWLAPSRFFRRLAQGVGSLIGVESVGSVLAVAVRVAFATVLLLAILLIARAVARRARDASDAVTDSEAATMGASWGWALLLLMLLGPVLLPWYVTWVLPLAWLLPRVPRTVLIGTSVALAVSQWAAEPARFPAAYDLNILVGHYLITPVVAGLLIWLVVDLRRRLGDGAPMEDERDEISPAAG
jgi:hypothetical protein